MGNPIKPTVSPANAALPAKQVYAISAICLVLGFFVGYFFLGGHATPSAARMQPGGHAKLTLEQMKQLGDVQAAKLIEQSKADPKNAALLIQIAGIYQSTHQFKKAADYFAKALELDPKNVSAHTEMASCLYYSGDVDGAITQLNEALKYNPKDADSLFNLGMIKYRGKNDPGGAIAAWQALVESNPNLDRKPVVEQMIAEAKSNLAAKN
jgi:cytochrome c-type biogenesis protein CcmH/NrfG